MPVKYTHFVIAERGHQKNAAKPPRPETGWLVPKRIVLEFERTTPSAPFIGTGIFLDGASTPPLPRRGVCSAPSVAARLNAYTSRAYAWGYLLSQSEAVAFHATIATI